jgi:hypothetical protein
MNKRQRRNTMSNWNASNYQKRKVERQAKAPAQWVQNPETEEWFYLRRIGAMSSLIAGMMPSVLTGYAIEGWKEAGVDVGAESDQDTDAPKAAQQGLRDLRMMANMVGRSCVIPLLIPTGQERPKKLDPDLLKIVTSALAEKYEDFNPKAFNPESIMLDAEELDDLDSMFIYRWTMGAEGQVQLAGGRAMNVANLKSVPKKPARGTGASIAKQKLQQAS